MKINKQDFREYISFLYSEVDKENENKSPEMRDEVIRNFNLTNLYNDITNCKLKLT